MYPSLFRNARKSASTSARPARSRKSRPVLETLEGRQLLSLGGESLVNTTIRNAQFDSDNASAANGTSVVVWTDSFSSTDRDIRAQRYNSLGGKLGSEIVVSASTADEGSPSVAMNDRGDFVVTWTQAAPGGDTNVVARRYNSSGTPQGSVVQVGVGTFREHHADVAMDSQGRFTVAYVRDTNNNNPDVFAKRYDANGGLLSVINVGTTSKAETRPSIAMTPDGRFDVAYQLQFSGTDDDILMSRYTASGGLLGSQGVATSTGREQAPSVSMDIFGNAVVAYQRLVGNDFDIKARRVSGLGTVGSEINIRNTTNQELNPSVALRRTGGAFVVAYNTPGTVEVAEVTASNTVSAVRNVGTARFGPAVSIDASGRYLATYTSNDGGDLNIRRRSGFLA